MIENYHKIKRQLGKRPSHHELDKYGKYGFGYYRSKYGGYKNFLQKIGEHKMGEPLNRKYTRKQLLQKYDEIKSKIGHPPSQTDLRVNGISESVYITTWGSWKKFKEHVGDKINYHGEYTKEDVINAYLKAKQDAGRVPHLREVMKHLKGTALPVKRHFGGIKELVRAMGDEYVRHNATSMEVHYMRYLKARNKLGRPPLLREYKDITGYWPDAASKKLGGYQKFRKYCENQICHEGEESLILIPEEIKSYMSLPTDYYTGSLVPLEPAHPSNY